VAARGKGWPPAVATGIAFALVFLVLPNPLRVPQNNPTAAAEYAPVPGNQSSAQNANFSQTNSADSAGLGSGGDGSGALPGKLPPPPPPQFRPRQKQCYGNPPRQTEDPLSPPCVGFFEGDNGGSTWNGVTKDEIKIVLYNDLGFSGDMNKPWQPSDESSSCATGGAPYQCENLVRTVKSQLRYFAQRYQTYGRNVHVIAKKSNGGIEAVCPGRRGDADDTKLELNPFAVVHLGDNAGCYFDELAHEFKTPGFGLNSDVPRQYFDNNAPYVWGFFPDQESESDWSASFLCRKLFDGGKGKGRLSTDPTMHNQPRKFGLVWQSDSKRGVIAELKNLLKKQTTKWCGHNMFAPPYGLEASFKSGGQDQAPGIMTEFKRQNITTVICYCTPVPTELSVGGFQNAANSLSYYPEWYWDHTSRMFRAIWNQTYGDPKQFSFGVSHHWRNPGFHEQYWYKAYKTQDSSGEPNAFFNFDVYELFLNLFEGIQAAGPELTPQTIERGMFTFNYLNRNDPYEPIGGYGGYNSNAVSDYTFVDTAMGWWWDPKGRAPGDASPQGCLRVIGGGRRFYAPEWTPGDADIGKTADPCSQDDRKLEDRSAF
jgi:hypothetical protein